MRNLIKLYLFCLFLAIELLPVSALRASGLPSGKTDKGKGKSGFELPVERNGRLQEDNPVRGMRKAYESLKDSCDRIFLLSGEEIFCEVSKITETEVFFLPCNSEGGTLRTLKKSELLLIKFADGKDFVMSGGSDAQEAGVESGNEYPQKEKLSSISFYLGLGCLLTGFVMAVGAIVVGFKGLQRHSEYPGRFTNKWMAIAGIVLGSVYIALILALLFGLLLL